MKTNLSKIIKVLKFITILLNVVFIIFTVIFLNNSIYKTITLDSNFLESKITNSNIDIVKFNKTIELIENKTKEKGHTKVKNIFK